MENTTNNPLHKRQGKDKKLILTFIVKQVASRTELSLSELKKKY